MNKIFLSYQNSSSFFLEDVTEIKVLSANDFFNLIPSSLPDNNPFLKDSVITEFESKKGKFRFFELSLQQDGFLAKVEPIPEDETNNVSPRHLGLYKNFGSIIDSYSVEGKELLPYNSVFAIDKNIFGLSILETDYTEKCKDSNKDVDPKLLALTTLAIESNGNLVQYDSDGTIYFYLADHIADNSEFVRYENQPEDTFYISKSTRTIDDWVTYYFDQYL